MPSMAFIPKTHVKPLLESAGGDFNAPECLMLHVFRITG
jgi:hypothetical protein